MIKRLLVIFFASLFLFTPVVLAQYDNVRSGEISTLEPNQVINKDYFSTGQKVTVSGTVNGDTYLAGSEILVDGNINGDLLVAGGNVIITGHVTKDLRIAGGNVNISGTIDGNVTAVGGSITLNDSAKIAGSLVTAGGNVQVFAPIGKGITAGAGAMTVGNTVGSDILAGVRSLTLTSKSKVNGNLTYISQKAATLQPEASVSGIITQQNPPQRTTPTVEPLKVLAGLKLFFSLISFTSSLVVGLLIIWLMPKFTELVTQTISQKPWNSLGIGVLTFIVLPVLIFGLFITVLLIPLAFILIFAFCLILFVTKIFMAVWIGQYLMRLINQKLNLYLTLVIGLIIYYLVGMVPILGGILTGLATLVALGALLTAKRTTYLQLKNHTL